jgi:hypothetical protein
VSIKDYDTSAFVFVPGFFLFHLFDLFPRGSLPFPYDASSADLHLTTIQGLVFVIFVRSSFGTLI